RQHRRDISTSVRSAPGVPALVAWSILLPHLAKHRGNVCNVVLRVYVGPRPPAPIVPLAPRAILRRWIDRNSVRGLDSQSVTDSSRIDRARENTQCRERFHTSHAREFSTRVLASEA